MKKIVSMILVLALFSSFAVYSFAAGSPTAETTAPYKTSALPILIDSDSESAFPVYLFIDDQAELEDDPVVITFPWEEVIIVDISNADMLNEEDKEAFLAAYEAVKNIKDKAVKYFFWFDLPIDKLEEDQYVRLPFVCSGNNVEVTVNGNPMEVRPLENENEYMALLTELGAIAILCDAE